MCSRKSLLDHITIQLAPRAADQIWFGSGQVREYFYLRTIAFKTIVFILNLKLKKVNTAVEHTNNAVNKTSFLTLRVFSGIC